MPNLLSKSLLFFFLFVSACLQEITQSSITNPPSDNKKKTYIVLVDPHSKPSPFQAHEFWYTSLLSSSSSSSSFIHVYKTLIHGFSATLTSHKAKQIHNSHGVLSVFCDSLLPLHTTRSPAFLGLNRPNSRLFKLSNNGSDTIIGIIDTGIWPESESFNDRDLGPAPTRWRGECEEGTQFKKSNCNRKLIGARFFSGGYDASLVGSDQSNETIEFRSPRDSDGHGTHVASIAAGSPVNGAGFNGFAGGTSRGMAPRSRIAVYKVCWVSGCLLSDVCSAFEKAVSDGVDIVSVSLGLSQMPFYRDLLSIVSFRASDRGVLVVQSAGNEGPYQASIGNAPPWIMTVGAGTIDRDFPAFISLGNGKNISGVSVTTRHELTRNPQPLYLAGTITSSPYNFPPESVKGRIVLCITDGHVSRISLAASLKNAGAVAMIISNGNLDPTGIIAELHVIPAITVGISEAKSIEDYIMSDENPTAVIVSRGTVPMHAKPAPVVPSFSSRGPNLAVPSILKPDLIAPGVNILGAWIGEIRPSETIPGIQPSKFNLMSGTSMACPHVSGVAALIKSGYPEWSPSEIKSALMTTASTHTHYYHKNTSLSSSLSMSPQSIIVDEFSSNAASPFEMGVGHMWPERALDPGLVYDLDYEDYVNFLCKLNYTEKQIRIVTGKDVFCAGSGEGELSYPAMVVEAEEVRLGEVVMVRRLKKVSEGSGVYRAKVVGPGGYYRVDVEPKRLRFKGIGERLSFKISVRLVGKRRRKTDLWVGTLIWRNEDGKHVVKSPILVFYRNKYSVGL